MITVRFHKSLQKYTKVSTHQFDVVDFDSLYHGLRELFPDLSEQINKVFHHSRKDFITLLYDKNKIVPNSWIIRNDIPDNINEFYLVPSVFGSGKAGKAIAGIGIAAFAFFVLPSIAGVGFGNFSSLTGFSALAGKVLLGFGVNLALSSVLELLMKQPKPDSPSLDSTQRQDNSLFGALTNTLDTNQAISLNYGMIRVPGQFISGYIKTINHGKDDTVQVGDFF